MDNPGLSLLFYNYLCDVIGTEDVVMMRRHIFTNMDNVYGDKLLTNISSGSKAEGLDLVGSDIDIMLLQNKLPVYENTDEIIPSPDTYPLVMDTSECKPGFTRLKINNKMPIYYITVCENLKEIVYLSSTKWREYFFCMRQDTIIHGPCNSTEDGEYDYAHCLRCSKWILQSKSWILRSSNLYIRQNVINAIVEFGVLFVPIGCKTSPNFDLEWRISFSYAEKLLIRSFNHVQLLCYALLKILLKEVIKETTGDLLCSYFLKTIMLWIIEETKPSEWKPNRIIFCFMKCLDRLIYCVRHKTLVHYFIPDNDLFAERFNKEQQSLLLSTLNQLQGLGWICLLQTQTLKSFRSLLIPGPSYHLIHKTSYLSLLQFLFFEENKKREQQFKHSVYFCLRAHVKDFYLSMLSVKNQVIGQTLSNGHSSRSRNKQSYNIIRKRLCYLLIGLNFDAVSGWLLLASHFYVNKQYITCKEIVSNCMLRCTPDKFNICRNPSNEEQTRFTLLQRDLRIQPRDMIRKYIVSHVQFQPSSNILPEEMNMLDDRKNVTPIPPAVFGCFLKYLCAHRLGNQSEKDISLRELECVIDNKYFILNNNFNIYNAHMLLSVAYSLKNAVNKM